MKDAIDDGQGYDDAKIVGVKPTINMLLLQGQLQAISSAGTDVPSTKRKEPRRKARPTSTLAALLASLDSEDASNARALLRRAAACRQSGGDVEEQLHWAMAALKLCREDIDEQSLDSSFGGSSSSTSPPYYEVASLCATAEAHLSVGSVKEARALADEALALSRSEGQAFAEAESMTVLLKVHLLTYKSPDSKQVSRELLSVLGELGATWGEVVFLFQQARERLDEEPAAALLRSALVGSTEAREAESRWELVTELAVAALAHAQLEGRKDVMQLLDQLLSISRTLGGTLGVFGSREVADGNNLASVQSQLTAAETELSSGSSAEACRLAAAALRILREAASEAHRPRKEEARALWILARAAIALPGQPRHGEAFTAASEALELSRAVGDRRGEAGALHVLAETLTSSWEGSQGGADEALKLGSEAGRILCDLEDRRAVALLLGTISKAHLLQNTPDAAVAAARDALETFRELRGNASVDTTSFALRTGFDEASALHWLAKAQLAHSRPADALKAASEALALCRRLIASIGSSGRTGFLDRLKELEGDALLALIHGHLGCGDLSQSIEAAKEASGRFRVSGEPTKEAVALQALANAYLAKKQPAEARAAAASAVELLKELEDKAAEKQALQLLVTAELLGSDGAAAIQTAKQAVERFRLEGDRRNEALALQTVAKTHIGKGEFLRGAKVAKDAQRILHQLGDTTGEIDMLRTAVEAHLLRPEKDGLDDALRATLDTLSAVKDAENLRGEALGLNVLAKLYVKRKEPETAIYVVRDAVALHRELGDRKAETNLLREIINRELIPAEIETTDEALRAVKAALAVCHDSEDKRGQAVMLQTTFRILAAREKPERAIQAADEAIKLYQDLEDKDGEAEVSQLLAALLIAREDYKRALVTAQRSAELFKAADHASGELSALQLVVDIHIARGDHTAALQTSAEVLDLARGLKEPASEASLLQKMCEVYLEQGGKENAEVVVLTAKQAHSLARAARNRSTETAALVALARSTLMIGKSEEACQLAREAVHCAKDSNDRQAQIAALQAMGDISLEVGRAFDALEAAKQAMELSRFEGLVQHEAAALATVVRARLANAEPSEALRAAKEAHDRAKRLGNVRAEAAALQAVATVCLHIRAPLEAIQACDGAQAHYKKLKDRKKEAAVLGQAVKAQLLAGDAQEALRAAKEGRALCRELRDRKGEAEALDAAAQVHMSKENYNEALDCARSMAVIYEDLRNDGLLAKARQTIASLYLAKGDLQSAIEAGDSAATIYRRSEDIKSEAAILHTVAQAHLQRFSNEQSSRESRGMRSSWTSQDATDAVKAALRARTLFRQLGDLTAELEALETLARAYLAKRDTREGLKAAEEALTMARRARDRLAEASALLICASGQAEEGRLAQALRASETAKSMFQALGHAEGLKESERFLKTLSEASRALGYKSLAGVPIEGEYRYDRIGVSGFGQDRDQMRSEPQTASKGSSKGNLGRAKQGVNASSLFNRKAFPWTPHQVETHKATGGL